MGGWAWTQLLRMETKLDTSTGLQHSDFRHWVECLISCANFNVRAGEILFLRTFFNMKILELDTI